jgi:2-iminobutanoate/2-iminopropanoate deaminase
MTGDREAIEAAGAPQAVGPYSHAIRSGDLLFCSGQIPLGPASAEIVGATAPEQLAQCLRNLEAVCAAAGTSLARAVRLTIYTTEIEQFVAMNEVYGRFFDADPPARVAVGVASLPKGALVEVDAVVAV